MKRQIMIVYIIITVLLMSACKQMVDIDNPSSVETVSSIATETSWRDRFEVRDTATVVAELKDHFTENRDELEQIAQAMFRDDRNTEEYPFGLYGSYGKLYARNSTGEIDFSNPIESETADLIATYYAKGFSKTLHIHIGKNLYYVKEDVCIFSYAGFLEDDGVLTNVNLVYYEGDDITTYQPAQFIDLDDHWKICIYAYAY